MSKLFSVIDIETNGGFAKTGKITEIAIFVTDGENIISEFCSLINPESYIPPFIQDLTGITNEMVEDAPRFYEIAKEIVEITRGTVFVAHNAKFDYSFIKQEFAFLGYDFTLDVLCTLSLSRKLFKGHRSYSLGNLCNDLGINLENRHRAFGDARATVDLFNLIYKYDYENFGGSNINGFPVRGLNEKLDLSRIDNLPEKFGIYYFYNENDEVIYIGRSKNIKSGVLSFLKNKKNDKIKLHITNIDYELTGCELISRLKEADELGKQQQSYNKRKRNPKKWGIYSFEDENGYVRFCIKNIATAKNELLLGSFPTENIAGDELLKYCMKYNLCQKLCGFHDNAGACFYYSLGECSGACCGEELPDEYNKRAYKLIDELNYNLKDVLITISYCNDNKTGIVLIRNYKYIGFGLLDKDCDFTLEDVDDFIGHYEESYDIKQIIFSYLKSNSDYKLIYL